MPSKRVGCREWGGGCQFFFFFLRNPPFRNDLTTKPYVYSIPGPGKKGWENKCVCRNGTEGAT